MNVVVRAGIGSGDSETVRVLFADNGSERDRRDWWDKI